MYSDNGDSKSVLVSIIVPCYKVEEYLPRCIDSLLAQTLQDIEIICINDGSPDRCIDILREYERLEPNKIVVIDKENEGVWRGRQDAIKIARGKYIGFVDSDDYVAPDFCEQLYSCAQKHNADIAVCGFYRVDFDSGDIIDEEMSEPRSSFSAVRNPELLLQLNGAPWNKLFRANLLKGMHDFDCPPRIFDDIAMHLLVYPDVDKVAFVDKALVYYLIRPDSIMTTIDRSKIGSAYEAFVEVRDYYLQRNVPKALLYFLDAAAFLHLGISLMFRISYDRDADLREAISENRKYLNREFPSWATSRCISFGLAIREKGPYLKLYFARLLYKANLMPMALAAYRMLINRVGIEVKW